MDVSYLFGLRTPITECSVRGAVMQCLAIEMQSFGGMEGRTLRIPMSFFESPRYTSVGEEERFRGSG